MKKYKKGFSLVEMMLVLGVILSLTILKINDVKVETENVLATSMADQIKAIANATNAYIKLLNYNNITSLNTSSKKSQDLICDQVNTCEITLKTLKNNFLIPKGFNENSLMGKSYKIELKRKGIAPNYTIDGIVLTDYVGFKNGDKGILFANKILNNLGIDGGVSVGQEMKGMYGSWSAKRDEYKSIKEGMVGTLVGYNSNLYSVYLRRDGTLPMTGNLNLGNNDINSIKNLNASGTIVGNIVNANT